jgi:hypothetical protein
MADQNYIDRTAETKIVGQDSTGDSVNYVSADANGNMLVKPYSNGPVTPGAVAAASNLIGGQFNTALPTLTNTQQSAIQVDSSGRLIIRPLTSADVVSAAQSGTWTTGRTWTLASGTDSVSAVQSGTWNIGTLTSITNPVAVTGTFWQTTQPVSGTVTANQGTSPWVTKDQSDGPVTPGTVASFSQLAGGQFNTALPTLTTGQQSAIQLDASGRLIIAPTTQGILAEDHNYGTVGVNTLRTASQIGNATGAADFAAGNSSAQTLRVVIATNQAAIPVTGTFWQTTQPVSGTFWQTTQPVSGTVAATQSGTWTVQQGTPPWTIQGDSASGASKAGNPVQIGGVFNTTQPTVTTGQTVEAQSTARGALIVATGVDNFNINNISGTISLPTGAATSANQSTEITSLQLIDNPIGSVTGGAAGTSSNLAGGIYNTTLPTLTNGQQVGLQVDSSGRLIISPTALAQGSTTSGQAGSLTLGAVTTNPPAYTTGQTDSLSLTIDGDLRTADIINTAGQYRAQSVTTTAAEALGAATILANRKSLTITPTNGTIYWGFSNAVTTTTGTPIFKNQTVSFAIGANVHVWLIAAATTDSRITEGS